MKKFLMPAGIYYIGDLCYVMHNEWDEVCDKLFSDAVGDGKFKLNDGREFVSLSTMYGDGCYFNLNRQYSFDVDAGIIGCIKVEDLREELPPDAAVINFAKDFECFNDNGMLVFGHIAIDTAGVYGELENEESEYEV